MRPGPVSVLMPVRNGASTVGLALADVVVGMAPGDELLIVDDGSEDSTPDVVGNWLMRDSRLRMVTTPGIGLVNALNLGIREASHSWLARADADDRYPRDRLTLQRNARGEDIALVTGDYRLVPRGGWTTYLPCALGHPFVGLSLINPQRLPHPGVMLRRDAVLAVGGYRIEDFPAEDLGLWLRLSTVGKFVGVPGVVVDWTMATGSVSHSRQSEQRSTTRRLLEPWRPGLLEQVDEDAVRQELARYESSSYAMERSWLLVRDLRAWHQRGADVPGLRAVAQHLVRHPVAALSAGRRLRREASQRRRARSNLMNPPLES